MLAIAPHGGSVSAQAPSVQQPTGLELELELGSGETLPLNTSVQKREPSEHTKLSQRCSARNFPVS